MGGFKLLILLTYHENKDCLIDNINNINSYCENSCIVINNGSADSLNELALNNIHVVQRKNSMKYYDTMIPVHLEMWDYILTNNIISDYVLLMASNQLFIRHNFYNYVSNYDCGFGKRIYDLNKLKSCVTFNEFKHYYDSIGEYYFKYQTNHDGMFLKYALCKNMFNYFSRYKNTVSRPHHEEYLYSAYLLKYCNQELIANFSEYNYIDLTKKSLNITDLNVCIDNDYYIIKRVSRSSVNDEVRIYVRERGII